MYYIIEHDMGVNQIIDTKGKANKYGEPKLFYTSGGAVIWLSKHYKGKSCVVGGSLSGKMTSPFYEVKEATPEQLTQWRVI